MTTLLKSIQTRRTPGGAVLTLSAPLSFVLRGVKKVLKRVGLFSPPPEFANSANPGSETVVWFSNEVRLGDDGWAMLAPYGDHPGLAWITQAGEAPRQLPAVQRIDREAATEMVNNFHSLAGRVTRWLVGVPIYIGHPDSPGIGARWTDKGAKGTIAGLEARETGLFCRPVFSNEAMAFLESRAGIGFSGRWSAKPAGDIDGKPVFRPDVLKSAGLTDNPNLPVELLNQAVDQQLDDHMKDQVLAWLKTLGIELANDATDAQLAEALGTVATRANAAVTLENEKTTLTTERDSLKSERDAKATEFANERKRVVDLCLDKAILEGRLTTAERPAWASRLSVDFQNEAPALEKLAPKLKTQSQVGDVSQRKAGLAAVTEGHNQVLAAVRIEMENSKTDFSTAWERVKREQPALFGLEAK